VHLVGQVQRDNEVEVVAVKKQVQAVSNELEDKLAQTSIQTNAVMDQLTSRVIENKSCTDNNLHKLDQRVDKLNEVCEMKDTLNENASVVQRRQRESIELINQQVNTEKSLTDSRIEKLSDEIIALRSKASERDSVTRSADSAVMRE
jgi:hypothetical protein